MPSVISLETYKKLKNVFKDEDALISFLTDLDKKFEELENLSKKQREILENNLYARLIQKLPTKEEFKSEIKRLEDKITSLEEKMEIEVNRLENKMENEIKRLESKIVSLENKMESEIKRLENKIENEVKRLEGKIENLSRSIDLKFKIVIGLIILGFTIFNPNFVTILKMIFSFFK